jgi:hypothetical protein
MKEAQCRARVQFSKKIHFYVAKGFIPDRLRSSRKNRGSGPFL